MRRALPIALAALLIAGPASAEIETVTGPLPETPESRIYGASSVPGAQLSIDLAASGYVEEEYFIAGKADALERRGEGQAVLAADLPYVTRIVVRRPADPKRFSGFVHFEPIHPSQGGTSHWLVNGSYIMDSGDIYVAVGMGDDAPSRRISREGPVPTAQSQLLKWFDKARYAPTAWPEEDGIRYQVMADIGALLRGASPNNPLHGLRVRRMIVGGWSFTGSVQRSFINEGFHDRARLSDGKPVFDGYLIGISSRWNGGGYVPLNSEELATATTDPRRALKPIDVPVVEFLSEFEVATGPGAQLPDSDAAPGRHRLYELGGTIHSASLVGPNLPRAARPNIRQLALKNYPVEAVSGEDASNVCPLPTSDVPHPEIARAVLANLKAWADGGPPPPKAPPLTAKPDGSIVRDANGNPLGGIRIAEFEQPLASYGPYGGGDRPECVARGRRPHFVRQDFDGAALRQRYGTVESYVARYDAAIDRLVGERWLLAKDAAALKRRTREQAIRQFGKN